MSDLRLKLRTKTSEGSVIYSNLEDREIVFDSNKSIILVRSPNSENLLQFSSVVDFTQNNISIFDTNGNITDSDFYFSDMDITDSNIWSADKINTLVLNKFSSLHWQKASHSFYNPTSSLPSHTSGIRYISQATANGWTINRIYESDGSTWIETIPTEGYTIYVENTSIDTNYSGDRLYSYRTSPSSGWVSFSNFFDHNSLLGLQGGTTNEYYHLTSSQHSGLTSGGNTSLHIHDDRYFTESEINSLLYPGDVTSGTFCQVTVNTHGRVTGGSTSITNAVSITAQTLTGTTSLTIGVSTPTEERTIFSNSSGHGLINVKGSSKELQFQITDSNIAKITSSGIEPLESSKTLGISGNRWNNIYATSMNASGTITCSTINATTQIQVNGSQISTSNLSNGSNIAFINSNHTISGLWSFSHASGLSITNDLDVGGRIQAGSGNNYITIASGLLDITKFNTTSAVQYDGIYFNGTNWTRATPPPFPIIFTAGGSITPINNYAVKTTETFNEAEIAYLEYPDDNDTEAHWSLPIPQILRNASSNMDIYIYYKEDGEVSGVVRWLVGIDTITNGENGPTFSDTAVNSTVEGDGNLTIASVTNLTINPGNGNNSVFYLRLKRLGTHVNDTLDTSAKLIYIKVEFRINSYI